MKGCAIHKYCCITALHYLRLLRVRSLPPDFLFAAFHPLFLASFVKTAENDYSRSAETFFVIVGYGERGSFLCAVRVSSRGLVGLGEATASAQYNPPTSAMRSLEENLKQKKCPPGFGNQRRNNGGCIRPQLRSCMPAMLLGLR